MLTLGQTDVLLLRRAYYYTLSKLIFFSFPSISTKIVFKYSIDYITKI